MNSKVTAIVSYITWVGLIVAVVLGEKDEFSKHHMNQAFTIWLIGTISTACMKLLGVIPIIGKLCGLVFGLLDGVLALCMVVGLICAILDSTFELPIVGKLKIF